MALGRSVLRTDRFAPAADVVDFWCCFEFGSGLRMLRTMA